MVLWSCHLYKREDLELRAAAARMLEHVVRKEKLYRYANYTI
jgi:hypothetical protein